VTLNWNRKLSGLIALIYIISASVGDGGKGAFIMGAFCVMPLACIWFSDAMGGYIGPTTSMPITQPSPGWAICVLGWLLLLVPIIIIAIESIS
jgi:hypothetical protein